MESTINAIFVILGFVLAGSAIGPIYRAVKTETVLRVHQGLEPLSGFTRRLTAKPRRHFHRQNQAPVASQPGR